MAAPLHASARRRPTRPVQIPNPPSRPRTWLTLQNRHRTRSVDLRLLRRVTTSLLTELLENRQFNLGIFLLAAPEMTRLNETFLRHKGSTDVITFNYADPPERRLPALRGRPLGPPAPLHAEIFVCLDEALAQARRFRTTWQAEIVRYIIHGLLHLRGCDDQTSAARRTMKRQENRFLRALARRFPLGKLRPDAP